MDEIRYTIFLADGTQIPGCRLNGNNYIVEGEVYESIFDANLSPLVIRGTDETSTAYDHAELVQAVVHGTETWMIFREVTPRELRERKMQADIEYIAMMADVELED